MTLDLVGCTDIASISWASILHHTKLQAVVTNSRHRCHYACQVLTGTNYAYSRDSLPHHCTTIQPHGQL